MGLGEWIGNGFPPVRQQELWRGSCCRPRKTLRPTDTQNKNGQAHKMTVLRISSYHAGKIPDYSEKQLHIMSFYRDFVIICGENERAGQAGEEKKCPANRCSARRGRRELWWGPLARREYLFYLYCFLTVRPLGVFLRRTGCGISDIMVIFTERMQVVNILAG